MPRVRDMTRSTVADDVVACTHVIRFLNGATETSPSHEKPATTTDSLPVLQPICAAPAAAYRPAAKTYSYADAASAGSGANSVPLGNTTKVTPFHISKPRKPATKEVIDPTRPAPAAPVPRPTNVIPRPPQTAAAVAQQPPKQQRPQQQQAQGWPQSLRDYVSRAFEVCKRDKTQDLMEKALKTLIDDAVRSGTLWTASWDTMAVPSVAKLTSPKDAAFTKAPPVSPGPGTNTQANTTGKLTAKKKRKRGLNDVQTEMDEEGRKRAERESRFGDGHAVGGIQLTHVQSPRMQKQLNMKRQKKAALASKEENQVVSFISLDSAPAVRGTCQSLEKSYFRLTSAPPPSSVRPLAVLRSALKRLKDKVRENGGVVAEVPYPYLCDQLKAIRQDVTVQHLALTAVAFCIDVYETHARYALEAFDFAEFNQCQTKLSQFYRSADTGNGSDIGSTPACTANRCEFLSYHILYSSCVLGRSGELERLRCLKDLMMVLRNGGGGRAGDARSSGTAPSLQQELQALLANPMIAAAMAVSSAVALNNYVRFFALYTSVCEGRLPGAPQASKDDARTRLFTKLARVLMDDAIERQRFRGLHVMCSAYRPTMPIASIATHFGFRRREYRGAVEGRQGEEVGTAASDRELDEDEEFECQDWLSAHGAVLTDRLQGDAHGRFKSMEPKLSATSIYIPEKEEAVAHGDVNLHASDFFSKNFSSL